jgi:hypothetical protein
MTTLDYARTSSQKPYRHFFLFFAVLCLTINVAFYLSTAFVPLGFPHPQWWIRLLDYSSGVAFLLGLLAVIGSLISLFFRFQSLAHTLAVVIAAIVCIVGLPLANSNGWYNLQSAYHHPFYRQIMHDARTLAQDALLYADEHNNHYPPHPAVLVLNGSLTPKELACRHYDPYVLPSPIPPISDWPLIAPELDAHSLFVYTAGDYDTLWPPAQTILVYSKPSSATPGYRIVFFGDCKTELLPEKDLPTYFAASNAARAKLGLPPFFLDGPPPSPPTTQPLTP